MMKSVNEYRLSTGTYYDIEYDNGTIKRNMTADELSREELYCWRFLRLMVEYRFRNCITRRYIAE